MKKQVRSPVVYRGVKVLLWGFSLVFGTVFVAATALMLTLLSENLELTKYKSYAEQGLQNLLPNAKLTLETAHLSWDRDRWSFALHAQGVKLKSASLKDAYKIPKLHVSWPFLNILAFQFQPAVVELRQPKLKLRDYSVEGDAEEKEDDLAALLDQVVEDSPVEKIIVSRAEIDLKTHTHGQWKLKETDIVFKKEGRVVTGSFVTHLKHIGKLTGVLLARGSKPRKLKVAFKGLNPKVILNHPYLSKTPFVQDHQEHLSDFNAPLSGVLSFYFSEDFQVERCKFHLDCGKGEVKYAPHLSEPFPMDAMVLEGSLTQDTFLLKKAVLSSPMANLTVSGSVKGAPTLLEAGSYEIDLKAGAQGADFSRTKTLWPGTLGGGSSRDWVVENIPQGTLKDSSIALKLHYDVEAKASTVEELSGTLDIEKASLRYMEGLPMIQNMAARAVFDKQSMTLEVSDGNTYSQTIGDAKIKITGLQDADQFIDIDLTLEGAAQDALRIIDVPRLQYATKYGLDPKAVKGQAASRLRFKLPLALATTLDQVDLSVATSITQAFIPNVVKTPKVDLSDANLDLKLEKNTMTLKGTAKVNGAPSTIDWWESYDHTQETQATLEVKGSLGPDQLAKMGWDAGAHITGSGPLQVNLTKVKGGRARVKAHVDMTPLALSIPAVRVQHPAGAKGSLSLDLSLKDGVPETLTHLKLSKGGTFTFESSADFVPKSGLLQNLTIDTFQTAQDRYSGKIIRLSSGLYTVLFSGSYIDLHPLLESTDQMDKSALSTTPFKADIKFDRAQIQGKPFFKNLTATFQQSGQGYVQQLDLRSLIDSKSGRAENCTLKIETQGQAQTMDLRLDDLGTALAAFGAENDLKGGQTVIQAKRQLSAEPAPWEGDFKINKFVVLKAPMLMNLLKVVNPMNVVEIFSKGEGMTFQSLSGGFVLREDALLLKKSLAVGPSIGMTVEGRIDRQKETLDLKGTVIPAYLLNSMISYIPIIGQILAGGVGEGVVAIPYTITGPLDAPEIKSQPLGAITPGILRKMFESKGSAESGSIK